MTSSYWQDSAPMEGFSTNKTTSWISDNDSGDDLFDNIEEIDTLPMNPSSLRTPKKNRIADEIVFSSPPATIPTQLVETLPLQRLYEPNIQVAASSPVVVRDSPKFTARFPSSPTRQIRISSPVNSGLISPKLNPQPLPLPESRFGIIGHGPASPARTPKKPTSIAIDLTNDSAIPYAGSSSEDEGKKVERIQPSAFYSKSGRKMTSSFAARKAQEGGGLYAGIEMAPPSSFRKSINHLAYKDPTLLMAEPKKPTLYNSDPPSHVARKKIVQRGPDMALPVIDPNAIRSLKSDSSNTVYRLKAVFPHLSQEVILDQLAKHKGHYDDTADALASLDDDVVEVKSPVVEKTTKRNLDKRAKKTVAEKYSLTQATAVKKQRSPSPPAPVAEEPPKPRRRLIKGSDLKREQAKQEEPEEPIAIETDSSDAEQEPEEDDSALSNKVLAYINSCTVTELMDVSYTTEEVATSIIANRPFRSLDDIRKVSIEPLQVGRKAGRRKTVGDKVADTCLDTWRGYEAIDSLITQCDKHGKTVKDGMQAWGVNVFGMKEGHELDIVNFSNESVDTQRDSAIGTPSAAGSDKAASPGLDVINKQINTNGSQIPLFGQPKLMANDMTLKDYQVVGINWLNLLYRNNLSCMLSDEMGLGKTCQVIAFMAHLKETGEPGPHLVVVPASTLENWLREFKRFCPSLRVEPYYGKQAERAELRMLLENDPTYDVLVTTYNVTFGSSYAGKIDHQFLRSIRFNVAVFDEGHALKNSTTTRHISLMKLRAKVRLLLTGTPLQNNLQELISLLAFMMPDIFKDKKEDLQNIFKYKAKTTDDASSQNALLSKERIRRAKAMMTPFILRRQKKQVLKDLPAKTKRVEYCELSTVQKELYKQHERKLQKALDDREKGQKAEDDVNKGNTLMKLRQAALHPLLFRRNYDNHTIKKMAKSIMREPKYDDGNHDRERIREEMEWMNDFELDRLCREFPDTMSRYLLTSDAWMKAGKVDKLETLLIPMIANGDRILVFSQFTQVLDILELVMTTLDIAFVRLDGSTPVDQRQEIIDQYYKEEDIPVFLLSTKAGGFGINLACANKVIIFDSSFNPMDDLQAEDRAHRVGQTRDVEVIRLITKGTVEEQILNLANTKLALDASISGLTDEAVADDVTKKGEEEIFNIFRHKVIEDEQDIPTINEPKGKGSQDEGKSQSKSRSQSQKTKKASQKDKAISVEKKDVMDLTMDDDSDGALTELSSTPSPVSSPSLPPSRKRSASASFDDESAHASSTEEGKQKRLKLKVSFKPRK